MGPCGKRQEHHLCGMCGSRVNDVVGAGACPKCQVVYFCCEEHMKMSHDQVTCTRMKGQKERGEVIHEKLKADLTWYSDDDCTRLENVGVHEKMGTMWCDRCLCGLMPSVVSGRVLKDLWTRNKGEVTRETLREKLDSWYGIEGLADILLLDSLQSREEALGIRSWTSYYVARGVDGNIPIAILMDMPMTVFWGVQRLVEKRGGDSKDEDIKIYIVGVEGEFQIWPLFLELGSLMPDVHFEIHMIGPELPSWCHGKQVKVQSAGGGAVILIFAVGLLQENFGSMLRINGHSAKEHIPDIFVGLNAGLGAYPSWMDALQTMRLAMQQNRKPQIFLFTDYLEEAVEIGRKHLYSLFGPLNNPDLDGIPCVGYFQERDISSKILLSETLENPFKSPVQLTTPSHTVQLFPNGFGCFVDFFDT